MHTGTNLLDAFAQRVLELADSFSGDGGNFIQVEFLFLHELAQPGQLVGIDNVDLRRNHDQRLLFESGAEARELGHDDFEVLYRIGTAARVGNIDHVGQSAGSLDVAQKLGAQAGTRVRA